MQHPLRMLSFVRQQLVYIEGRVVALSTPVPDRD
jgi:hypothetical protein